MADQVAAFGSGIPIVWKDNGGGTSYTPQFGTSAGGGGSVADLSGTGTITAAQPSINTPIASATVVLAVGTGRGEFKIQLSGTFSAGSTVNFDASNDGGTTWWATSVHAAGGTSGVSVSSVVGGANALVAGNSAAWTHIRARCSVLQVSDSINVTITSSTEAAHTSLLAALPVGSNLIGSVVSAPIVISSVSVTRPANTTAYSARQIVNHATSSDAPLAFAGATRVAAGNGFIMGAKLEWKVNVASPPSFQLYLFTSSPVNTANSATGPNDAQVLGLTSADNDALIPNGIISFSSSTVTDATASTGGSLVYMPTFSPIGFALPAGSTIYGLLVVTAALTPTSGAVFTAALTIAQN